jgi:3-dehydroquinate dehydratase-1
MKRIKKPVIVSYHNFEGMPGPKELRFILDEIYNTNADIAKVAVTPERLRDNLQLLSLLLGAFRPTCIIGMGEIGRHLRAVAPLYGSVLTYGHLGEAFAPGQMSVSELFQALRILGSGSG